MYLKRKESVVFIFLFKKRSTFYCISSKIRVNQRDSKMVARGRKQKVSLL
jgi:hypothetical protein